MTAQSGSLRAATKPLKPSSSAAGDALFDTFNRLNSSCTKAYLAFQDEWFRFVASRFEWDGEVGQALAACKTFDEVAEVQRDWLRTTAKDYAEEMSRLTQLAIELAPKFAPPFTTAPASKEMIGGKDG